MPRIRTIKPEFFISPDTASVSHTARLLYIAMWCMADDYGKGEFNMLQLRAFAFPEDDPWLDKTLEESGETLGKEFQSLCKEVVNGYGIKVYKHRGRTFYAIPSWDAHQKTQRRAKSKNPDHDDPESAPDQRFHPEQGTSEEKQGSSESTQGKSTLGTGNREQGNRGSNNDQQVDRPLNPSPGKPPIPDTSNGYPDGFEKWWGAYPRKVGKRKAFEAWFRALQRIRIDDLQAAAERFAEHHAQEGTDPRFIPHPTTWLNRDGWSDELTPQGHTHRPGGPQTAQRRSDEQVLQQLMRTPQMSAHGVVDGEIITQRQIG